MILHALAHYAKRHHLALIALFVALGGVSYAATSLPRNSVDTQQLRSGAVTGKKIARNAVSGPKVKPGSLGADTVRLRRGEAIHGAWALRGDPQSPTNQYAGISLPIPSTQPVDSQHVVVAGNDAVPGDGCAGTATAPVAAPGFVCIYFAAASGTTGAAGYGARTAFGVNDHIATGDGSPYGFVVGVSGNSGFRAAGTWAYTAP